MLIIYRYWHKSVLNKFLGFLIEDHCNDDTTVTQRYEGLSVYRYDLVPQISRKIAHNPSTQMKNLRLKRKKKKENSIIHAGKSVPDLIQDFMGDIYEYFKLDHLIPKHQRS